jgi:predicted nucleotidyltransferase
MAVAGGNAMLTPKELMDKIIATPDFMAECNKHGSLVLLSLLGSHLFGTANENSDVDVRGIFVPSLEDCILNRQKESVSFRFPVSWHEETLDVSLWSIQKFVKLLKQGDTNALSLFFSHTYEGATYGTAEIENLLKVPVWEFAPADLKGMRGYVYSQAIKYGAKGDKLRLLEELCEVLYSVQEPSTVAYAKTRLVPIQQKYPKYLIINDFAPDGKPAVRILDKLFLDSSPTAWMYGSCKAMRDSYGVRAKSAKESAGVDWKAFMQSLRVLTEMIQLYETGKIVYPLHNAEFLTKVKKGNIDIEEAQAVLDSMLKKVEELETAQVALNLPRHPERLDDKVVDYYRLRKSSLSINELECCAGDEILNRMIYYLAYNRQECQQD